MYAPFIIEVMVYKNLQTKMVFCAAKNLGKMNRLRSLFAIKQKLQIAGL